MDSLDNTRKEQAGAGNTELDIVISNFKKNLDIAKDTGDQYYVMDEYLNLILACAKTEQYGEAACHAKECIRAIKEISSMKAREMDDSSCLVAGVYTKNASLGYTAASAYFNLGQCEVHLGLYEDALDSFQKCLAIATEIGDEIGEVSSCYRIAKLYEAKNLWKDVIEFSGKYIDKMSLFCDKEMEIEANLRLATAYEETNSYEEAVVYSKKCIEASESESREYDSALSILGASYFKLSNYDEAVNYNEKCLEIAKNTDDKEAEMVAHFRLAYAYNKLHQCDRFYDHANKGMVIAQELGIDIAKKNFSWLLSEFFNLVGMEEKVFLFDPGLKAFFEVPTSLRQELEALLKAKEAGDIEQQILYQLRLHNFYKSKRKFESALNCLKQGMALKPDCDEETKLSYYSRMLDIYITIKKYEEGLELGEAGLCEVAKCNNKIVLFDFFFCISQLYVYTANFQLAEKYLKEAVQCFETLYGSVGSNEYFKISMVHKYNRCFRSLSLVYLQTNRKEESLLVLDKCRARVLKDTMVDKYGMQENKEGSADRRFSDIEALVSSNQFAIVYYSICGFGHALVFVVGHNLFEATVQKINFDEKKFNQIIDDMFAEIELLEEVNCEDRSLDTKKDIKHQNQQEEDEVGHKESTFKFHLQDRNFVLLGKTILMEYEGKHRTATALEFLYCMFVSEELRSLIGQSEIIFIPDGSLCKIPFAALQDPNSGKYLSETKRIRLAPSIATLKLLIENAADYPLCNGGALVIGDPDVGKVMICGEVEELPRLESAQKEANIVARNLGVEPLIGEDATKPAVLEKLQQGVSVVHIAAHGSQTNGTIALAPSPEIRETKPIPDEEDYMLTMADVQQAKVRAQLVVLSCCHSGRGEIRAEGVVGMCRAFLASGARAVVASLWAIDDDATLEFMTVFYDHLKNKKSASTSLQLTMNEMRSIDEYKEPKYWAPFFLMGDDVMLKFI